MEGDYSYQFSDGEIIFSEYEKGDYFYFIKSGKIKLVRYFNDRENILDVLNPGVFFGEMAIIENEIRSATAIAYGEVVLLRFSKENFEEVILKNLPLAVGLIKRFVNRIWTQQQLLSIYKYKSFPHRVAALLTKLKVGVSTKDSTAYQVHVTVEDLSKWAGIDVSECKAGLHDLVTQKLISVQEKSILIIDLGALERYLSIYEHSHLKT